MRAHHLRRTTVAMLTAALILLPAVASTAQEAGFAPCAFTLTINGTLDVSSGTISGACIRIGPGGAISGAGPDSYLQDPLLRATDADAAELFFPVGDGDSYRPTWLSVTRSPEDVGVTTTYISRVDGTLPPALGTMPDPLLGLDLERSWQVGRDEGPEAAAAAVTLSFGDDDFGPAVDAVTDVRLVRLTDDGWTVVPSATSGTLDDGTVTSTAPLGDLGEDQRFSLAFIADELTFPEFRSLQEELISIDQIEGGVVRSLQIKLNRAQNAAERGDDQLAASVLRAYEDELVAKRGTRELTEYAYLVLDDGLELLPVTP